MKRSLLSFSLLVAVTFVLPALAETSQSDASFKATTKAKTATANLQAILGPSPAQPGFGSAVAVSADGKTIAVGITGLGVDVFLEPSGGWTNTGNYVAQLTVSSELEGNTGLSVAISADGNTIAVGSNYTDFNQMEFTGAVFVYQKPAGGWVSTSSPNAMLTASDQQEGWELGTSVAISGNTVVASAPYSNNEVYVWTEPSTGWTSMTQTAILTPSDGVKGDSFGQSVAIEGNTIAVGSINNDTVGAVYVYVEPASGWSSSTQTAKLTATNAIDGENLGSSVALNGSTLVSGAVELFAGRGEAFVFQEPAGGWADETDSAVLYTPQVTRLGLFGASVAVTANAIAVGAEEAKNSYNGAIFLYQSHNEGEKNVSTGLPTQEIIPPTNGNGMTVGASVAFGGNLLVIGGPIFYVERGHPTGQVFIYSF